MKSGNLNFLQPSGPLQACKGTALHFFTSYGNMETDNTTHISKMLFHLQQLAVTCNTYYPVFQTHTTSTSVFHLKFTATPTWKPSHGDHDILSWPKLWNFVFWLEECATGVYVHGSVCATGVSVHGSVMSKEAFYRPTAPCRNGH